MATTPTTPFPRLLASPPSQPTARPSFSTRRPPTLSFSRSVPGLRRLAATSKDTANSKGQEQEPSAAAEASEAAKGTEELQAASTEKSQEAVAAELKEVLRARKEAEVAASGGAGRWAGVAQEMAEIEWPAPGKVMGTTGVVLGVIAGSTAALLSVNALLASDVNDPKVSETPRKQSLDGPGAETTAAAKMEDVIAPNHILENTAMLPNHRFPAPVIKPSATNAANSRAVGTPISPTPGVMVSSHTGVSTELSVKDERELKRERRKQSNRESARRSRLRKQAETEELVTQVESLTAENTSLRSEISRLTESSENLRSENSALMVKLKDTAAPNNAEVSLDKTAASSSPRVVENFLSMIDNTYKPGISRHTEHGEPKLGQLLGSSPATDVIAAT